MSDDITLAIQGLTHRMLMYRLIRRGTIMPLIEIKGLASSVANARKGISEVRAAATSLNVESAALVNEMNDIKDQVAQHRKDLRFEAETLGNGAPDEEQSEKQSSHSDSSGTASTERVAAGGATNNGEG